MATPTITADTTLIPTRFQLNESQVAAGLHLAGLQPSKLSPLPRSAAPAEPVAALRGTGMLDPGGLNADAAAAMRTLADPGRLLAVVFNRAGSSRWQEALLFARTNENAHVALARSGGAFDIALLPRENQAVVLLDELFGFSALSAEPGGKVYSLDLAGYVALLTAADLAQQARLEERVSRGKVTPEPLLNLDSLQVQLEQTLQLPDTRWAVTAARRICPIDFLKVPIDLRKGIGSLETGGLAKRVAGGHHLTPAGYRIALALGQIITTGGVALSVARGDEPYTIAHVTVFRTAMAIWLGSWIQVGTDSATVELVEVSARGALLLVRGLLDARDLPKLRKATATQCAACGSPLQDVPARFCRKCAMPPHG